MKLLRAITEFLGMLIGVKNSDAVNAGIVDYSGQGRDKYGK